MFKKYDRISVTYLVMGHPFLGLQYKAGKREQLMKFYFAPMEGITGYVYRRAYHEFFPGVDKFFTPFLAPKQEKHMSSREKNDVLPEHNQGMYTVPQILCNRSEDFIRTAKELFSMGYEEINLNLGCPSATVVTKKKGAGLLGEPLLLEHFLDDIFSELSIKISIKTRLGMEDGEEFENLLKIYNRFPLHELIVHPRVREDYYKKPVRMEYFSMALERSRCPVCYNGDIATLTDLKNWEQKYPQEDRCMLGRGLLTTPGLIALYQNGQEMEKERLYAFHQALLSGYREVLSGERNVLFKMKELWFYMLPNFADAEKAAKRIRKAERISEYEAAVRMLFEEGEFIPSSCREKPYYLC